jgi:hypothetical protein
MRTLTTTPAFVTAFATFRSLLVEHAQLCKEYAPQLHASATGLVGMASELEHQLCQPEPQVRNRPENAARPALELLNGQCCLCNEATKSQAAQVPASPVKTTPAPKAATPVQAKAAQPLTEEQLATMDMAALVAYAKAHGIHYRTVGMSKSSLRADIRRAALAGKPTTSPSAKAETPKATPPTKPQTQTPPAPKAATPQCQGKKADGTACTSRIGTTETGYCPKHRDQVAKAKSAAKTTALTAKAPASAPKADLAFLTAGAKTLGIDPTGLDLVSLAAVVNSRLMSQSGNVRVSIVS